jgi:hypothetical protein
MSLAAVGLAALAIGSLMSPLVGLSVVHCSDRTFLGRLRWRRKPTQGNGSVCAAPSPFSLPQGAGEFLFLSLSLSSFLFC